MAAAGSSAPGFVGEAISSLTLFKPAPTYLRVDVIPFAVLYASLAGTWLHGSMSRFFALAGLAVVVILHILSFLLQHWSVAAYSAMSWIRVQRFSASMTETIAISALVRPQAHRGKPELVKLQRDEDGRIHFAFQKNCYEYNRETHCFEEVQYPTDFPMSHYLNAPRKASGLAERDVELKRRRFGQNRLEMPSPSFRELYIESLLAPFFVFQVFCVFLWMLDEYWQYSVMTLFMMLTFEATVVHSRLRSLRELRGMRNRPRNIFVYRAKKWVTVTSLDLLPGDIISVPRSQNPEDVVPCDVLILAGSVVVNEAMLTGESVPLMKEGAAPLHGAELERPLSVKNYHKGNVLFGGTRVLTHTSPGVTDATPSSRPPDSGSVCYVLRTGFGSAQGQLMRTILFSTDSVSANSREAALFILFLLVFAIAASGYVLTSRFTDDADARYKLVLRCVLIITSVVPPELPMQLSLAVNTSLVALAKAFVFCTEPFRIPFAGKVDVCCFDKTGTLTTDSINAAGVAMPPGANKLTPKLEGVHDGKVSDDTPKVEYPMVAVTEASVDAAMVLATCHSLVHVDTELIGDPLELAALSAVEWSYGRSETSMPKRGGSTQLSCHILQRFSFASALQRMSVIAEVQGVDRKRRARVLTKGSPEAVSRLLAGDQVPDGYFDSARALSRQGMRVLALAFKDLDEGLTASQLNKISREDAEKELTFAGFVCFECPLRSDSRKVIRMLKRSGHDVMMITGDATLTAAHVARQVSMSVRNVLILEQSEVTPGTVEWISAATGKRRKKFSVERIAELAKEYDLCVSGPAFELARSIDPSFLAHVRHVRIFARMSPNQKEDILTALKEAGLSTLMCGDGTNDVGALKQAHVGVALLSSSSSPAADPPRTANGGPGRPGTREVAGAGRADVQRRGGGGGASRRGQTPDAGKPESKVNAKTPQQLQKEEIDRRVKELTDSFGEADDQPPLVKLGDASIASPFTSRRMTIDSCATIIRQGRCTLATTMQMYQILALNCLISAYSLSVLYLDGVALGDKQLTITGFVMAIAFFLISRSKPLKKLTAQRPAASIFAPELFVSLLVQFGIHLACLMFCTSLARDYVPFGPKNNIDAEFRPSVMNTVVFLMSIAQQVSVFVVNYKGRPFMQGLLDNRGLMNCLLITGGIVLVCTAEISPELNEFMELSPWPDMGLQAKVTGYIAADFISALVADKLIVWAFAPRAKIVE